MTEGIQSPTEAKKQFAAVIDEIKAVMAQKMRTKQGRDSIRACFGCRIEDFEQEDKEWFNKHPWSEHQ